MRVRTLLLHTIAWALAASVVTVATGQGPSTPLDATVQAFLNSHRGTWRDLNVPESDGRALYDLIVKHGFRRALEIGTSTGHSGVWIAWALSKTGGKLTTIEIDAERHRTALANFKEAGIRHLAFAPWCRLYTSCSYTRVLRQRIFASLPFAVVDPDTTTDRTSLGGAGTFSAVTAFGVVETTRTADGTCALGTCFALRPTRRQGPTVLLSATAMLRSVSIGADG